EEVPGVGLDLHVQLPHSPALGRAQDEREQRLGLRARGEETRARAELAQIDRHVEVAAPLLALAPPVALPGACQLAEVQRAQALRAAPAGDLVQVYGFVQREQGLHARRREELERARELQLAERCRAGRGARQRLGRRLELDRGVAG